MGDPKGKLVTPVADNPDDEIRSLEVDASDNLKVAVESLADPVRHMKGYCPETTAWKYIRVNSVGEIVIDPIEPDKINIEPKARAYLSTIQLNLVHNTWTKVLLDTENYDIGADFDTTNNKFVVPVTGYYVIAAAVAFTAVVVNKLYAVAIYKGASSIALSGYHSSVAENMYMAIATIDYLTKDDEITLYAYSKAGVNTVDVASGTTVTFLSIHLLSV